MSKRFGRNQKRELKQQIAELKGSRDYHAENARQEVSRSRHVRSLLADVRRVAGEFFVGLDPQKIDFREPPTRAAMISNHAWGVITDTDLMMHHEYIPEMLINIEMSPVVRETIDRAIHYEFTADGNRYGYTISKTAMQEVPKAFLIEKLSKQIAKMIVNDQRLPDPA
ncbi:hypothetical protein [Hahella ganghwensis]|uniref:hypothetical protein n=1 Tax=Hahella ganghwensis TaxID=286420 RepID=UPI0003643CBB|nr:hypothetical protein [Hahella ganghwensis]